DARDRGRVSIKTFRLLWTSNTEVSGITLCPLARPKKAIGQESQIGPWLATLQSLRLSVSRNEWAPSRQWNETTGEKRDLAGLARKNVRGSRIHVQRSWAEC